MVLTLRTGLALWLTAIVWYVTTANKTFFVHNPRFEMYVWVFMGSAFVNLLLFASRNPLQLVDLNTAHPLSALILSCLIVPLSISFIAQSLKKMMLKPFMLEPIRKEFRMLQSRSSGQDSEQQTLTGKVREINGLLDQLSYSSELGKLVSWAKGSLQSSRKQIFELIDDATPNELNQILSEVNLPRLFTYGNHFITNQENRTMDTLMYLLENREHDLTTFARAAMIHTLMRLHTISFSNDQMKWALTSFLGCKGKELTLLKALLDSSGDYNNLLKLVFVDIQDIEMREQILSHINKNAREQIRLNILHKHTPLKVLSDVDDTLYASGGKFPAGTDARLPKHAVYPGVLQLFEEIDVYSRSKSASASNDDKLKPQEEAIKLISAERREGGIEPDIPPNFDLDGFGNEISEKFFEKELKVYLTTQEENEQLDDSLSRKSSAVSEFFSSDVELDDEDAALLKRSHSKLDMTPSLESLVKVRVDIPWTNELEMPEFTFDTMRPIYDLHESVKEKFGLPPWKQSLRLDPVQRHSLDSLDHKNWRHGNIVFLSARPNVYKDISESQSYRVFQELIADGTLHATPTMLTGSLRSGLTAISLRIRDRVMNDVLDAFDLVTSSVVSKVTRATPEPGVVNEQEKRVVTNHNWRGVGEVKVNRFKKFSLLYPECKFLFFGDNAQGDLYAAEKINKYFNNIYKGGKRKKLNRRVVKCLIHRVSPIEALSAVKRKNQSRFWKQNNIVFFDTYVGAALECLKSKLITVKGALRVTQRAREEMIRLKSSYTKHNFDKIIEQLDVDIVRANKVFAAAGLVEKVAPITSSKSVAFAPL